MTTTEKLTTPVTAPGTTLTADGRVRLDEDLGAAVQKVARNYTPQRRQRIAENVHRLEDHLQPADRCARALVSRSPGSTATGARTGPARRTIWRCRTTRRRAAARRA